MPVPRKAERCSNQPNTRQPFGVRKYVAMKTLKLLAAAILAALLMTSCAANHGAGYASGSVSGSGSASGWASGSR